jgi:hypothetical protein
VLSTTGSYERLRFQERFGDASSAILQTIVDELNHRQALAEFVASDDARTGARTIKEPGRLLSCARKSNSARLGSFGLIARER